MANQTVIIIDNRGNARIVAETQGTLSARLPAGSIEHGTPLFPRVTQQTAYTRSYPRSMKEDIYLPRDIRLLNNMQNFAAQGPPVRLPMRAGRGDING